MYNIYIYIYIWKSIEKIVYWYPWCSFGIQLLEDWEVSRSIRPRKSVLLRAWSPRREMARRKWHTTGGTSDESCLMHAMFTHDRLASSRLTYRLQMISDANKKLAFAGACSWEALPPDSGIILQLGFVCDMLEWVLRCFKGSGLNINSVFEALTVAQTAGGASFVPLWAHCLRGTVMALSRAVWKYLRICCHDLSEGMHPWYLPF